MSGGAYSLLGQQLGDVLLNWERKSAPYRPSVGTSYLELGTETFSSMFSSTLPPHLILDGLSLSVRVFLGLDLNCLRQECYKQESALPQAASLQLVG